VHKIIVCKRVNDFATSGKPVIIMNFAKGMVRLNHWEEVIRGMNQLVTTDLEYGETSTLKDSASDSWTLCEEDYSPFLWMNMTMSHERRQMTYQVRQPFVAHLVSSTNIELRIYNTSDRWDSQPVPTTPAIKWLRLVTQYQRKYAYQF